MKKLFQVAAAAVAYTLALTACTNNDDAQMTDEIEATAADSAAVAPDAGAGELAGLEEAVANAGVADANALGDVVVHFGFDDSVLSAEQKAKLSAVADQLKANSSAKIQIMGHTDERGSTQYNLALGERRAHAVKEFLVSMGVTGVQITTVSMGEEQPAAVGQDESAYSQNRRANLSTESH